MLDVAFVAAFAAFVSVAVWTALGARRAGGWARGLNRLARLLDRPAAFPTPAPPLEPTGEVSVVRGAALLRRTPARPWDPRVEGPTVEHTEAPMAVQVPLRGAGGGRWIRVA